MTWQTVWTGTRKKELPNRLRKNPTISFRPNLHPITLAYINDKKKCENKTQFINQSIEMRFFMLTNKRGFLRQVLEYDYNLCRYLLRKIGGRKKFQ